MDLALLQASAAIASLHDDTLLTTEEAAVFLRLSKRTMESMRTNDGGPPYWQGGERVEPGNKDKKGTKSVNQKITYRLGDLKAWRAKGLLVSTVDAAVKKGQLQEFASAHQLFDEQPFWKSEKGIAGICAKDDEADFLGRFGKLEIVWMAPFDAALEVWEDAAEHKALADDVSGLLNYAVGAVNAAIERSELARVVMPPPPGGRKRVDVL